MAFWELMLLAVGLSMDAFAVAICKGLAMDKVTLQRAAVVGLWFGGFQGLMPLLGWLLGSRFAAYITAVDHWIAFALLVLLGINMIREARCPDEEDTNASLAFRVMLPLAMGYPAGWLVCSAATLLYYRRAALGRQRLVEDN